MTFSTKPIKSPCVGVCKDGEDGLCLGCFRTKSERQSWSYMKDSEKEMTLKLIERRKRKAAV